MNTMNIALSSKLKAFVGYPFKVGQLAYHYHGSKTSGMLATAGRGFRCLKSLRYIGVPP